MAKKKEETVVKETPEQPIVDDTVEKIKVKKPKKKKFQEPENNTTKVNIKELREKAEEITKVDTSTPVEEVKIPEEKPVEQTEDTPIIEEVTDEEKIEEAAEIIEKEIVDSVEKGVELPEMFKS